MSAQPVDVLAALGACRMETATVAAKCGVPLAVARDALRAAEAAGTVETVPTDGTYWRRGAARPLVWRARQGGAA